LSIDSRMGRRWPSLRIACLRWRYWPRFLGGRSVGFEASGTFRDVLVLNTRVDVFKAQLPQLILADVLDVTGGGVQPQPAVAVDVSHP
jgi:hypothetical protein